MCNTKRGKPAGGPSVAAIADTTPKGPADRRPLVLAVLVGLLTINGAHPGVAADSTMSRVRSVDRGLAGLIDQATQGSATFRGLLATIQASNGIVYVEPGECRHGVRACLKIWMQLSTPNRFVRIVVKRQKGESDEEVMGSLGHELQHAIEVLSEPAITNGLQMFSFLQRTAPTDSSRFETTAAVYAGDAVRDELVRRRATVPVRLGTSYTRSR